MMNNPRYLYRMTILHAVSLLAPVLGSEITCSNLLPVVVNASKDRSRSIMEDEAWNNISLSTSHSPANSPFFDSSSSSLLNSFPMKQIGNSEEIRRPVDRRFNRMMKNRESAARSRNRKMAYTFELERKKVHLIEENARLRKEVRKQELVMAAVAATQEEAQKKPNLSKSMSALF